MNWSRMRCRVIRNTIRPSGPDSGLGFQVRAKQIWSHYVQSLNQRNPRTPPSGVGEITQLGLPDDAGGFYRRRAIWNTISQSGPDYGLGFQVNHLKPSTLFPFRSAADHASEPSSMPGLPGKGNSNSHCARTVHLIITTVQWNSTSRLSIKNSLFAPCRFPGSRSRLSHFQVFQTLKMAQETPRPFAGELSAGERRAAGQPASPSVDEWSKRGWSKR